MKELAVEEEYAPKSICFGCGPAIERGLGIKSYRNEEGLEMEFETSEEHMAFEGIINGGIIGTLIDCHGNWTAAVALMDKLDLKEAPCTVTAQYEVKLKRPTPYGVTLFLKSRVLVIGKDRAEIIVELKADGKTCATGRGLFVIVKEGHPAYHRWK